MMPNMDFSKMPWGNMLQGFGNSALGLMANAPQDPHQAAVDKLLADQQAAAQTAQPSVMPATQPEPLRDTIQNAMPPSAIPEQSENPVNAQVGTIEPALSPLPGQLPQQAGLTKPAQYQYQPQQMQTVLDTLRQGAQIQ